MFFAEPTGGRAADTGVALAGSQLWPRIGAFRRGTGIADGVKIPLTVRKGARTGALADESLITFFFNILRNESWHATAPPCTSLIFLVSILSAQCKPATSPHARPATPDPVGMSVGVRRRQDKLRTICFMRHEWPARVYISLMKINF